MASSLDNGTCVFWLFRADMFLQVVASLGRGSESAGGHCYQCRVRNRTLQGVRCSLVITDSTKTCYKDSRYSTHDP